MDRTGLFRERKNFSMTTDPGDLVLDPTCGSGTTATVAEQWGRRWITIDTSRVALTLARARLMGSKYDYYLLKDSDPIDIVDAITELLAGRSPISSAIARTIVRRLGGGRGEAKSDSIPEDAAQKYQDVSARLLFEGGNLLACIRHFDDARIIPGR